MKEGGGGRFPLLLISVSDELQHLMLHPHTLVYMIAHLYMLSFAQVICESCNWIYARILSHQPTHRFVCREGAGSRMEGGMKRGRTLIIQMVCIPLSESTVVLSTSDSPIGLIQIIFAVTC